MAHDIDKNLTALINNLCMFSEKDDHSTCKEAINLTRFAFLIEPGAAFFRFNLACFYSEVGSIDDSLRHLEDALQQGFRDWKKIVQNPSLENARRTVKCWKIIDKYFRQDKRANKR